ncbi:hypothetical protein BCV72DRAFT_130849 [Rhizopus microsporus var. microsporus]|uniref:Secreted protein n=1 Tax=Rhizopus microsporus var. microsporus TaxID=86635 RepID=A0A1X0R1V4_RHIZD|nr:hypothetical protein BCV72DRAFT_130849 [Rhizopus microsporus var. microsporus]
MALVLDLGLFTLLPCLAFFGIVRGHPIGGAELSGLDFLTTSEANRRGRDKRELLQACRGDGNRRRRTFGICGRSMRTAFLAVDVSCRGANKVHIILVVGRGRSKNNVYRAY